MRCCNLLFHVYQVIGLLFLSVPEEGQFICSKRWSFCTVHSDSHHLSQCTSCCIVFASSSLFPPHWVGVPCYFRFVQVILKVPLYQFLILGVVLFPRPLDSPLPACLWIAGDPLQPPWFRTQDPPRLSLVYTPKSVLSSIYSGECKKRSFV